MIYMTDANSNLIPFAMDNQGNLKTELLWTNESPSSAFLSQTISIGGTNYNFYLIEFLPYKSDPNNYHQFCLTRINESCLIQNFNIFQSQAIWCTFRSVIPTQTSITFNSCVGQQSNISGNNPLYENNDYIIPYKIYGIR